MLKENQPRALNLFTRQLTQNKVSHAYLLVGENDTKEMAQYMTQSLFCETSLDGACGKCDNCKRIEAGNHGDYVFLSGKDKSIKKEDVMNVKSRFLQTSLEDVKHKVYVIENVDNASLSAMNSFLKFLEEPESNVVAILTTYNLNKVIDTIKSRCLIVNLEPVNKNQLENALILEGIDAYNAKVLSFIASNKDEALSIHDDKMFHQVLDTFSTMKRLYRQSKYVEAGISLQVAGIKNYKFNLKAMQWLCMFHEMTYSVQGVDDTQQISLKDLEILRTALKIKDRIRPGVITSMLIDQFVYELNTGV